MIKKVIFSMLMAASVHKSVFAASIFEPTLPSEENAVAFLERIYQNDEEICSIKESRENIEKSLLEKKALSFELKSNLKKLLQPIAYLKIRLSQNAYELIGEYIPETLLLMPILSKNKEEIDSLEGQLSVFRQIDFLESQSRHFSIQEIDKASFERAKLLSPSPQLNGGHINITAKSDGRLSCGSISAGSVTLSCGGSTFHVKMNTLKTFFKTKIDQNWTIVRVTPESSVDLILNLGGVCVLIRKPFNEAHIFSDSLTQLDELPQDIKTAYDLLANMILTNKKVVETQQQLEVLSQEIDPDSRATELQSSIATEREKYQGFAQQLNLLTPTTIDQASTSLISQLGFKNFTLELDEHGLLQGSTDGIYYRAGLLNLSTGGHDLLTRFTFLNDLALLRVDDRRAAIKIYPGERFSLNITDGVVSLTRTQLTF